MSNAVTPFFTPESSLQITLGAGNHKWLDVNLTKEDIQEKKDDEEREVPQLDFTIRLTDKLGQTVAIKVSDVKGIPKPLKTRFTKFKFLDKEMIGDDWEIQLQTYHFPLSVFTSKNPDFNIEQVKSLKFIFDQSDYGVVIVDEIGVSGL